MASDQSYITVSLPALVANWQLLAGLCPGACGATVKANAYGLGVERVAPALAEAGCETFFVATLSEAITLRSILPEKDIFVFSGVRAPDVQTFLSASLTPVLNSAAEVQLWADHGKGNMSALHIDTGMSRLGCNAQDSQALAGDMALLARAGVRYVMTHLACTDEPGHPTNVAQAKALKEIKAAFAPLKTSFGNSGGVLNGQEFCGDLARPGIGLYGGNPRPKMTSPLKPVVEWTAPVLQCREIKAGTPVGYGSEFVAERPMTVATIGAGYADGVARISAGQASVFIDNTRCKILGRISMDSCVADVTHLGEVPPATPAQLLGHLPLSDLARWSSTIDYEVLTGISERVERRYLAL